MKGEGILGWAIAEFNDVGEKALCARVQTCSWSGPSCIAAFDARYRADVKNRVSNTLR